MEMVCVGVFFFFFLTVTIEEEIKFHNLAAEIEDNIPPIF